MNASVSTQTSMYPPQQETSYVLEVQNLIKRYKSKTAVDHISFNVRPGEIVGLLGLNGAGKTTTFRMTCGLIPVDEGNVFLDGQDVSDWPMYRRAREGKMGYLPQDRSVFSTLTTEKNLYIIAEQLGMKRSEQKKRCQQLITDFRLEKIRKDVVGTGSTGGLSGGERRRLEFARALLSDPKILLLDEPFANVDPPTIQEIQEVILDLSKKGIAFLITDHKYQSVLAIASRAYVISNGVVLCSGTPKEVLSHPVAQKSYFCEKDKETDEDNNSNNSSSVDSAVNSTTSNSNRSICSPKASTDPSQSTNSDQQKGFVVPDSENTANEDFRVNDLSERSLGRHRSKESKTDHLNNQRSLGRKRNDTDI